MDNQKEAWIRASLASIVSAMEVVNSHKLYNDWGTITNTCSQIVDTAKEVLDSGDLDQNTEREVRRGLYFALHNLALYSFINDDNLGALEFLKPVDLEAFPLSAPLVAACYHEHIIATTRDAKKAIIAMLPYMQTFEKHKDAVFAENPISVDQLCISGAYLNLSIAYRIGLGVPMSLEKAYHYLQEGLERLDDDRATGSLRQELSHYRAGFFGGLKYV